MATLNPELKPFWKTQIAPDGHAVRFRTLHGGRMSSKSHDAAGVAIARANFRTERFLCMRMYQNRISDSVYTLLKDKIYAFGLQQNFKIYADAIEHRTNDSLFRFYGIQRNVDEIKSFEGCTVGWVEEAHNLTEEMFTTIRPTIMRNPGAEMWFTMNPRYALDYSYKRLIANPPAGSLVHQINYDRNPFLVQSALDDIAAEFEEDWELANHIYNGVPLDDSDASIIKRTWILAAIDAHTKVIGDWSGPSIIGYDVADDGADKNATTTMSGRICTGLDEWKAGEDELDKSALRVRNTAKQAGAMFIGYDSIGVGAGTGAHLRTAKWPTNRTFKFNAGATVIDPDKMYDRTKMTNREMFANLKAQSWWYVAKLFRNTFNAVHKGHKYSPEEMISIDSQLIGRKMVDQLVEELSTPHRDIDNNGRVKVESKKDLAKRDIDSPNVADSFIIANSSRVMRRRSISEMM